MIERIIKKANALFKKLAFELKTSYVPFFPEIIQIEPTNACTLECIMCPRKYMTRKIGFMDFGLFKKIIDDNKLAFSELRLHHFGDPLLHPKIFDFIDYASRKRIKTWLFISPVNLNKKNSEKILTSRLSGLLICMDGYTKKTFESVRKNAIFEECKRNILEFIKLSKQIQNKKLKTKISIIKMKPTAKEIEKFKKFWENKGLDVYVQGFTDWSAGKKEISKLRIIGEQDKCENFCKAPWSNLVVLWNGWVVPCCLDFDAELVLGDLKSESLMQIWNGKKMQLFREQHKKKQFDGNKLCKRCIGSA